MAVDRTKKYQCHWKATSGWAMMLEIMPAGELEAPTETVVFNRAAVAIDAAEYGFDKLPIGMMTAPACSFEFYFKGLDANLVEMLKYPKYTTETYGTYELTNIFSIWSDEGLGGALKLQYIGAQSDRLGNDYVLDDTDTVLTAKIETVDLLKVISDKLKPSDLFQTVGGDIILYPYYADRIEDNVVSSIDFRVDSGYVQSKIDLVPRQGYFLLLYTIEKLKEVLIGTLELQLSLWTRTGSTFYPSITTTDGFYPTRGIEFYKQTTAFDHAKSDDIVSEDGTDKLLILGHIATKEDANYISLGGFFSYKKDGAGEYESLSVFLNLLCENFLTKLKYIPFDYNDGLILNIKTYKFEFLRIFESLISVGSPTLRVIDNKINISTAASVYLRSESETRDAGSKNTSNNTVTKTTNDKADTWSTRCILHNAPTCSVAGDSEASSDANGVYVNPRIFASELRIRTSKLLYYEGGGVFKVHESVTIKDGIDSIVYDNPTSFTGFFDIRNQVTLDGWIINTQNTNCMQQAIPEYITTYWSDISQAIRSGKCLMVGGDSAGSLMPRHVGDVFSLPAITDLNVGQTSVFMNVKPDWDKGQMDCKFLSVNR